MVHRIIPALLLLACGPSFETDPVPDSAKPPAHLSVIPTGSGGSESGTGGAISSSTSAMGGGQTVTAESEPNYPIARANPIGSSVIGSIIPGTDADSFSFVASGNVAIVAHDIGFGGCSFDAAITLYGADGALAADSATVPGVCAKIDPAKHPGAAHLTPGIYYVIIGSVGNVVIPAYQIDITQD